MVRQHWVIESSGDCAIEDTDTQSTFFNHTITPSLNSITQSLNHPITQWSDLGQDNSLLRLVFPFLVAIRSFADFVRLEENDLT